MSIDSIVKKIMNELVSHSAMEIGKVVKHPDGREVKIKSGTYLDSTYGRVTNWWTWNEVFKDGSFGPDESGYGWRKDAKKTETDDSGKEEKNTEDTAEKTTT